MLNFIKSFRADEDGAVTVDWVVLTAAIVVLGMVVLTTIGPTINTTAQAIEADLDAAAAYSGN